MDRKIRTIMLVMALGTMCAGELMILSAQDPTGSATQQTQTPNDTSKGQASTQTPQDPVTQQTQSPKDAIDGEAPNGIRILGGIRLDPTINFGTLLNVIIGFFGVIIAFLGVVIAYLVFRRSKPPPELTSEEVSKPENASEVEGYIKAVDRNPKASLKEKAIADAFMLQRSEKIEEAIEKWRSIANIAEGHDKAWAFQAWASAGFLYIGKHMAKEALAALSKALDLKPDSAEVYNGRGGAKLILKNYQDALADCDEAIRLKPDYAEAYNTRALVRQRLERYQDALADCDEAIRLKPDYDQAYNTRGTVMHLLGEHRNTIVNFNKVIQLKPNDASGYNNRGNTHRHLGNYEAALADFIVKPANKLTYSEIYGIL